MADFERITKKRLGEILVSEGLITQDQVMEALKIQERTGEMLGEALIKAGYITETDIAKTLCYQFQRPFIRAEKYDIPKEIVNLFPPRLMIENMFVPLDKFNNMIILVMAGLLDKPTIQHIKKISNSDVEIYIGAVSDVKKTLRNLLPDYFDPVTLQPRFEKAPRTREASQMTLEVSDLGDTKGIERADLEEEAIETLEFADEDSDWEALFEEAEREVMKELKEKRKQQT
jgi:hypothetical protein